MTIDRRGFFLGTAAAAATLAAGRRALAEDTPKGKAALKLSSQLGVIPGKSDAEKIEKMQKWGFQGVELPGGIVGQEKKWEDALRDTDLKYSAVCFGSCGGALVSPDAARQKDGIRKFKEVLTSAGQLKTTGVIFVPAFSSETKRTNQEIRQILMDVLPDLGQHAVEAGSRLLLEPLNRNEAFFCRLLADAAAICRDTKSPGICMMGDFYHMGIEETSDLGAFLSAGPYLHHIHLASRSRVLPGQDERTYVDGFRGLKMIGYQDYCSFECGCKGNREVEIPKSMAFLRNQWAKSPDA